jgi:hypothetical protein
VDEHGIEKLRTTVDAIAAQLMITVKALSNPD